MNTISETSGSSKALPRGLRCETRSRSRSASSRPQQRRRRDQCEAAESWTLGESVPPNHGNPCRADLSYTAFYRCWICAEIEDVRALDVTTSNPESRASPS